MIKSLKNYEKSCEAVLADFVNIYYEGGECVDSVDWVGGEVGGIVAINDEIYNFSYILKVLSSGLTKEQNAEYYDYCNNQYSKKESPLKIKAWLALVYEEK